MMSILEDSDSLTLIPRLILYIRTEHYISRECSACESKQFSYQTTFLLPTFNFTFYAYA